jgi:AAHS family 4-hydroxybenzoate transporter-like MFS transporter
MPERLPLWPILLCALAVFFDGYEAQMLAMAVPLLAKHLSVAPTAFAVASSASLLGMAIGALVLAPLSDRFGRKPLLLTSLLLFGGGTLAALTIRSPGELAAWRLLAGCGLGAAVPVTIAMVSDWAPPARRVRVVTVMAMGFPVGASSAGLIAPLLTKPWGWQGLFVYGGVAPLVLAALVAATVREPARSVAQEKPVWRRVGALFTPALRSRTLLFCALNVVNLFANYGLASWLPTLLVQNGWSLAAASRATSVLAIGGLTASFVVSGLADRGRVALGFGGAYAVVATGLALCATNPASTLVWVLLLVLIGCSMGTAVTLGPLASAHFPPDVRATGVGFANGIGRFGSLFGPLALAGLMNRQLPPPLVLGSLMVPMLACAGLVTWLALVLRGAQPAGEPGSARRRA